MQLLSEEKLIWSPVVANSRMNRSRNAGGINSYEQEFKFKPEVFLESIIKIRGQASWLDLCCGEGLALLQTAAYLSGKDFLNEVTLTGIDLLDSFRNAATGIPVKFEAISLTNWIPEQNYDLITCSHGLHYIGDKLSIIEKAIGSLNSQGLFIANLDLKNIIIPGTKPGVFLKNFLAKNKVLYSSKSKIIQRIGKTDVRFPLVYDGADDNAGPNYTGQDAVNSFYTIK